MKRLLVSLLPVTTRICVASHFHVRRLSAPLAGGSMNLPVPSHLRLSLRHALQAYTIFKIKDSNQKDNTLQFAGVLQRACLVLQGPMWREPRLAEIRKAYCSMDLMK